MTRKPLMMKADQPIKSRIEDTLNRASFARNIAEAVAQYSGESSFCIGLYGKWGSGKTSLMNMIVEDVGAIDKNIIVVRFNPWLCSDYKQLFSQFFKQLATSMKVKTKTRQKLSRALNRYGDWFGAASMIPVVGNAVAAVGKAAQNQASQFAEEYDNNLQAQKDDITKLLIESKMKIVVSIDDIDRLSEKEIISVFQLVKSLADFPDTVYLLAFDYDVVIKALSKVQNGDGRDYLEKIVQVPFEIPAPNIENIQHTLFYSLDQIIGNVPEGRFDKALWGELFYYGISKYIVSIRDVNRFVNVFSLKYCLLKDEVDFVDLLGITALQVFEPYVYTKLPYYADTLCGSLDPFDYRYRQTEEKKIRESIEQLITADEQVSNHEAVKNIVSLLFPKAGQAIQNHFLTFAYDHRKYLAESKVASAQCYKRYFSLSLEDDAISTSIINRLFNSAEVTEVKETIQKCNSSGKIVRLIETIDAYIYDRNSGGYKTDKVQNIITVLLRLWPYLEAPKNGFIMYPLDWKVQDCVIGLLNLIDSNMRYSFIVEKLSDEKIQVSSLARMLERLESQHGRFFEDKKEEENKTVTIDQLLKLEQYFKERAIAAIKDHTAIAQKNGLGFLWLLGKIDENYVRTIKPTLITDEISLARVISYCTSLGRVASRTVHYTRNVIVSTLSEFIDVEEAYKRMKKYVETPGFLELEEDLEMDIIAFILHHDINKDNTDSDYGISEERIRKEIERIRNGALKT